MRHFLKLTDFTKDELNDILNLAIKIKKETKKNIFKPYMANKTLAMIFEKSSTRTRVSFEVGIKQLGGYGLFLSKNDIQLGRGEPIKDTARVISRMCDMVMMRTYSQNNLEEFASYSSIPVINGLTDEYHPIQLMADYLTIMEYDLDKDLSVAYIGDGNNMAHSWINLASIMGFRLNIATPKGYEVNKDILNFALDKKANISITNNPKEAIKDVNVITTDTWISMGQEDEKEKRIKDFKGFIIDEDLVKLAKENAIFLHCLPAYRGYEVSDDVFEKYSKNIFDEAENRLHAQKGIMVWLDKEKNC